MNGGGLGGKTAPLARNHARGTLRWALTRSNKRISPYQIKMRQRGRPNPNTRGTFHPKKKRKKNATCGRGKRANLWRICKAGKAEKGRGRRISRCGGRAESREAAWGWRRRLPWAWAWEIKGGDDGEAERDAKWKLKLASLLSLELIPSICIRFIVRPSLSSSISIPLQFLEPPVLFSEIQKINYSFVF